MSSNKQVSQILAAPAPHWVGDGFPVRTLFSMHEQPEQVSPFLLLDYAAPTTFAPTTESRGVEGHPHRGFETVTIVYQGALEHRDSAGNHGTIGPGDVQWMTAASGVIHEEKHEKQWASQGGTFQVAQLWVNLPRRDKMAAPRYQTLTREHIPVRELPNAGGTLRVIAGEFQGLQGAARTFTPINVFDLRLRAGHTLELTLPEGFNTIIAVLEGTATLNGTKQVAAHELALLEQSGELVSITADSDALLLVLNGEPIHEPIASYGPFVMTTREELVQATEDYRAGRMGTL